MRETVTQNSFRKIDQTIDLLNEAARLKREKFSRLLTDKISGLKDTAVETALDQVDTLEDLRGILDEAVREAEEAVRGSMDLLDKEVRRNPWPFLGGAALAALVFGLMIGNSKR